VSGYRQVINKVVYSLLYSKQLDEAAVTNVANSILERRGLTGGPQEYYDALTSIIDSGDATGLMKGPHSEAALLDFFTRLREQLGKARPWKEPAFTIQPLIGWDGPPQRAVARIELTTMQLSSRLAVSFQSLPHGDGNIPALLLRLANGREVGLLGGRGQRNTVTLIQRDDDDVQAVVEDFRTATGLPGTSITPLV
jgi:hypothetical protein